MKARRALLVGIAGALILTACSAGDGAASDQNENGGPANGSSAMAKEAATQRGREALADIGALTVIGHSFTQGVGVDPARIGSKGMVARLAALMGIPTSSVRNLGAPGAVLVNGTAGAGSTWLGLSNDTLPDGEGARSRPAPVAIIHGVNDLGLWAGSGYEDLERAYTNALRFTISRARAVAVFDDTDPSVVFAGKWLSGVTAGTGASSRLSNTSGDRFTITLPDDYQGETIAIGLIGTAASHSNLDNAIIEATDASVGVVDASAFVPGQVIRLGNEEMTITDIASNTLTVTRGVNGTRATTHASGARVGAASDTFDVTWSGSAGVKGSLDLAGQGVAGHRVPVVHRITNLTAANAGETIVGTVGHAAAEEEIQFIFDSWWLEAARPPPIAVANVPRSWLPVLRPPPGHSDFEAWNAAIAGVVAEFDDSVQIADVDAVFYERTATLSRTLDDGATTISIAAASAAFPTTGEFRIRIDREDLLVTNVAGSYPDYRLTVKRAINDTTAASHTKGTWVTNAEWFSTDNLHPNAAGHKVYARVLYETLVDIAAKTSTRPE